jgi:hypothetical protein
MIARVLIKAGEIHTHEGRSYKQAFVGNFRLLCAWSALGCLFEVRQDDELLFCGHQCPAGKYEVLTWNRCGRWERWLFLTTRGGLDA